MKFQNTLFGIWLIYSGALWFISFLFMVVSCKLKFIFMHLAWGLIAIIIAFGMVKLIQEVIKNGS